MNLRCFLIIFAFALSSNSILLLWYCPFNLLRSFKDGAHQSKTYFIILSDTHALRVRVGDQWKHHFSLKDKFMRACMRPPGRVVKKCSKTTFAGFNGYSDTHAC